MAKSTTIRVNSEWISEINGRASDEWWTAVEDAKKAGIPAEIEGILFDLHNVDSATVSVSAAKRFVAWASPLAGYSRAFPAKGAA